MEEGGGPAFLGPNKKWCTNKQESKKERTASNQFSLPQMPNLEHGLVLESSHSDYPPTEILTYIEFRIFGLLKSFIFDSVLVTFETAMYAMGALADTEPAMEKHL